MNKYKVCHKVQTLADFQNDCHCFLFIYNGQARKAYCYGAVDVIFDNDIPEDVCYEVQQKIYELIDKNEHAWAVPAGANEIADEYCREEFGNDRG